MRAVVDNKFSFVGIVFGFDSEDVSALHGFNEMGFSGPVTFVIVDFIDFVPHWGVLFVDFLFR